MQRYADAGMPGRGWEQLGVLLADALSKGAAFIGRAVLPSDTVGNSRAVPIRLALFASLGRRPPS
jgi:hypothetical protein